LNRAGGVFHVVSRFERDEWSLDRPGARDAYLNALGQAAATTDVEVLGYCLMSNHTHLVVIQGEKSLERLTKSLNTAFASWMRKSGNKPKGAIFAGRPRTQLVERDPYLLRLIRYIHNNPVRAQVARFARSSAWTSHQAYIGRVATPDWLQTGQVLRSFGRDPARAARSFDAFVTEGAHEPRRPELSGAADASEAALVRRSLGEGERLCEGILGSEAFVSKMLMDLERGSGARGLERRSGPAGRPPLRELADAVYNLLELDPVELQEHPGSRRATDAKRLIVWAWVHDYGGQQIDVARELDLETSTISRYYGQAIAKAGDFDQRANALSALLNKRRRSRAREAPKAGPDYHVNADDV
jgi:REP element-mobilizing transposase RayT